MFEVDPVMLGMVLGSLAILVGTRAIRRLPAHLPRLPRLPRRYKADEIAELIEDNLEEDPGYYDPPAPVLPPVLLGANVTTDMKSLLIQLEIVKEYMRRIRTKAR